MDALQPIVHLDCIHVITRGAGAVGAKAVYAAQGVSMADEKEILRLWIAQTEGAKLWLQAATELKNKAMQNTSLPLWMA